MNEQRVRTAFHEAAHAVVSYVLRRPIRYVSIKPGETFLGVMVSGASVPVDASRLRVELPGIAQPAHLRRRVEADICVSLAGDLGAQLSWMETARFVDPSDEFEAFGTSLAFAGLSPGDAKHLAALERDRVGMPFDEQQAAESAWALAGDDAWALLNYMRTTTRRVVWSNRNEIAALANELLESQVMSGRWVRSFLKDKGVEQW